jgi:thiol-disulfide isomerase/thioredoxin
MEEAGNSDYQDHHMSEIFEKGMSFSGYERNGLFMSRGDGTYFDISGVSGLDSITDGRGCSFADFDNDGDSDVIITPVQELARLLFKNNVGQDNGFIRVKLTGTRSGRDAFGTVVRLKSPLGTQTKVKLGGSGFLSASDPRLLFGLGPSEAWQKHYALVIEWPSGLRETINGVLPGESIHLEEGQGKIERITEQRVTLPEPEDTSDRIFRTLAFDPNEELPPLTLTRPSSTSSVSLPSILEPGRKTLINFWATWCAPCAVEIPELALLFEPLSHAGVDLMGISLDFGSSADVQEYLNERSVPYVNYILNEKDVARIFSSGQITVPLTVLVDEQGRVVRAFSGWSAETRAGIEALLPTR